jgi:hypothetical protein
MNGSYKVCSPTDADGINPIDPKLPKLHLLKYLQIVITS